MTYSLHRVSDGAGDAGGMSMAFWRDSISGDIEKEYDAKPRVGVVIRVGSILARTFQWQDWWQTSFIEEILEESESEDDVLYFNFKTKNSIYEWRSR